MAETVAHLLPLLCCRSASLLRPLQREHAALLKRTQHVRTHSTAQHSTAQLSTAQHTQLSTAQHSTAQHSSAHTAQHSTAQHSTAQHSTAQHSTAQHSTAQHSTAQHSTAQHSTAQHSTSAWCARRSRSSWSPWPCALRRSVSSSASAWWRAFCARYCFGEQEGGEGGRREGVGRCIRQQPRQSFQRP